jgi:hypothetical protein
MMINLDKYINKDQSNKKFQVYFCEECKTIGCLYYEERSGDLCSVVQMLGDLHIKNSPNCKRGTYGLRIINHSYYMRDGNGGIEGLKKFIEQLIDEGYMIIKNNSPRHKNIVDVFTDGFMFVSEYLRSYLRRLK